MKFGLPEGHGLSQSIIKNLVFFEDKSPALSDIQYESLEAGVGQGKSLLVVSPTSTGKTQIALWAIAKSVENSCNVVYLVTHRALAKQKFEDFKTLLLSPYFEDSGSALVIATGDYVENAFGEVVTNPLGSPVLVATYEKYLALLSSSGIPADMTSTVIVCDEIQLIGDEHRGQHVEVLLTLLRNAGWKQFVGLSAVLEPRDAKDLADWLGVSLVINQTREKHLHYECWTDIGIATVTTEQPENIEEGIPLPPGIKLDPISVLTSILKQKTPPPPLPIIVFCMKKQDTYDLAQRFADEHVKQSQTQLVLPFEGIPETSANTILSKIMAKKVAFHNADLIDEERHIVEQHLLEGKLDVVFATSTLAAGVNFPLGAAIFASWQRWNSNRKCYVAIEADEFHNMAGRVGRMGFEHEQGRVIFIANKSDLRIARQYLNLGAMPLLKPRVTPTRFDQLVLQLVASGLCQHKDDVKELVCKTFSALREQSTNPSSFDTWPDKLFNAISSLNREGFLIEGSSGKLAATQAGKAVAFSGLLPDTASFLLKYMANKSQRLVTLLPTPENPGDVSRLAFSLLSACYSAPEFRTYNKKPPTRFLPYPLENKIVYNARENRNDLPESAWEVDPTPINAAGITLDWIEGTELRKLESMLPQMSAGMLRDMFRNCVWVLQGFASIVEAASDGTVPESLRPIEFQGNEIDLALVRRLPRVMRRLSFRIAEGLPDDVIWMKELYSPDSNFKLFRTEILDLRKRGFIRPEQIILGTPDADQVRLAVFEKSKPSPQAKANWLRDLCRDWKKDLRKRIGERHSKRARRCPNVRLVQEFYNSRGTEFESVFENILETLQIKFEKLDDKTKTGAPDYLITLKDSMTLVMELKSKEGDKLVEYNKAVDVLAASEIHGFKEVFCVTLCHPGVDPSVPMVIASCGRLSVVESTDLGEALLRICEGTLTQKQLWKWLATPGQALVYDLPCPRYE